MLFFQGLSVAHSATQSGPLHDRFARLLDDYFRASVCVSQHPTADEPTRRRLLKSASTLLPRRVIRPSSAPNQATKAPEISESERVLARNLIQAYAQWQSGLKLGTQDHLGASCIVPLVSIAPASFWLSAILPLFDELTSPATTRAYRRARNDQIWVSAPALTLLFEQLIEFPAHSASPNTRAPVSPLLSAGERAQLRQRIVPLALQWLPTGAISGTNALHPSGFAWSDLMVWSALLDDLWVPQKVLSNLRWIAANTADIDEFSSQHPGVTGTAGDLASGFASIIARWPESLIVRYRSSLIAITQDLRLDYDARHTLTDLLHIDPPDYIGRPKGL